MEWKPYKREWQPTTVFVPGEFHRQRSLEGYSPRGHKELDTTELSHFYFINIIMASIQKFNVILIYKCEVLGLFYINLIISM